MNALEISVENRVTFGSKITNFGSEINQWNQIFRLCSTQNLNATFLGLQWGASFRWSDFRMEQYKDDNFWTGVIQFLSISRNHSDQLHYWCTRGEDTRPNQRWAFSLSFALSLNINNGIRLSDKRTGWTFDSEIKISHILSHSCLSSFSGRYLHLRHISSILFKSIIVGQNLIEKNWLRKM